MDPALGIGVALGVYAAMSAVGVLLSLNAKSLAASAQDPKDADRILLLGSFGQGLRGAAWVSVTLLYGLAAALTLVGFSDGIWLLALALAMDCALFLTWRDRTAYLASLPNAAFRFWEGAFVLLPAACLVGLWALRAMGRLVEAPVG